MKKVTIIVTSFYHKTKRFLHIFCYLTAMFLASPAQAMEQLQIMHGDEEIARIAIEVAMSPEQKTKGLMFRESLPARHGMLFLYNPPRNAHMWMKNTLIPLDMLFIDESNRIIHIHSNAKPHDLTSIGAERPVAAVLEINGGEARKLDIRVGDVVMMDKD